MSNDIKYPDVTVDLTSIDGNAFSIMGAVRRALSRAGVDRAAFAEYQAEAMSGDYDHLLQVTMRTVNVT